MVTLEQAFIQALEAERDWGEDGKRLIVKASERPEAWGFTLRDPDVPYSMPFTFFVSKDDGHEFYGPPVPPLENLDWWHECHTVELPERPDGKVIRMKKA